MSSKRELYVIGDSLKGIFLKKEHGASFNGPLVGVHADSDHYMERDLKNGNIYTLRVTDKEIKCVKNKYANDKKCTIIPRCKMDHSILTMFKIYDGFFCFFNNLDQVWIFDDYNPENMLCDINLSTIYDLQKFNHIIFERIFSSELDDIFYSNGYFVKIYKQRKHLAINCKEWNVLKMILTKENIISNEEIKQVVGNDVLGIIEKFHGDYYQKDFVIEIGPNLCDEEMEIVTIKLSLGVIINSYLQIVDAMKKHIKKTKENVTYGEDEFEEDDEYEEEDEYEENDQFEDVFYDEKLIHLLSVD